VIEHEPEQALAIAHVSNRSEHVKMSRKGSISRVGATGVRGCNCLSANHCWYLSAPCSRRSRDQSAGKSDDLNEEATRSTETGAGVGRGIAVTVVLRVGVELHPLQCPGENL
jgi:hypothetical protein